MFIIKLPQVHFQYVCITLQSIKRILPLAGYRFYCMALFHSQARRHIMIKSIKRYTVGPWRSWLHKICTLWNIANSMQLELQSSIALATFFYLPYMHCLMPLLQFEQTLYTSFNKTSKCCWKDRMTEMGDDRKADRLKKITPPQNTFMAGITTLW